MSRTRLMVAAAVVLLVAAAGCGSSSDRRVAPTEGKPPDNLVGVYTTTIDKGHLPRRLPEKFADTTRWQIEIVKDDGPNKAAGLTITSPKAGQLKSIRVGVQKDALLLHGEQCAGVVGGAESLYHWNLRGGKKLKIDPFRNGCKDKVTETILTSEIWTKKKSG